MVGFGLVYGGTGAVFWSSLAKVTSSWVISPILGAIVSFLVYKCIRRVMYFIPFHSNNSVFSYTLVIAVTETKLLTVLKSSILAKNYLEYPY